MGPFSIQCDAKHFCFCVTQLWHYIENLSFAKHARMRGFRAQHPQADENQSWGHATSVLQVVHLHTPAPTLIAQEDTQGECRY